MSLLGTPRPETSTTQRPTVLVVDDEENIARTLSMVLNRHGYHTEVAHNGEVAVELARRFKPDWVLCDILLPGINGIQAALQILELYPECPIILMSGNNDSMELLRQARSDGHYFDVMTKPFHPRDLIEKLSGSAG
jgi:CheY-like chemotaxis protein